MDLLDPFSSQLHHVPFDRLKSHTPFPCPATQSINIPLKFHCVFFILNFAIANAVISKKSYFRLNIWCDIINVKREQQGTKNSALGDTRQNWGYCLTLLHLQQFVVVWNTERNLSISMSCSTAKQFAFKEFMRGLSNAFSNVSICPLLSKSLAQSFNTVVNWVSQLCPFLNACCLSDRRLYSSRWAMIFEHTMWSSNLQGTQVKETGR